VAQLGDDLLQKIDIVVSEVTACAASNPPCIAAVVGLRQTLYPDAPAYQPRQTGQADAAQVGPSEAASVGSVS
jgi:hypothetical protein